MDELKVTCGDITFTFRPSYNDWIASGIRLTTEELIENFVKYNATRIFNECIDKALDEIEECVDDEE